jgi:hypothetical protein
MNYKLCEGISILDRDSYKFYLRNESLKKIINPFYKTDKTYLSYKSSRFFEIRKISYTEYLSKYVCGSINYSNTCNSLNKTISYTEYLAKQLILSSSSSILDKNML